MKHSYRKRETIRLWLVVLMVSATVTALSAQKRHAISLAGPNSGLPFSDGIVTGNTLYIAGQQGQDANGKLVAGGIDAQTRAALGVVNKVVKAAGFQMNDIVYVTIYLADLNDFDAMNKVYKSIMPDPKPARTTVQAARLVGDARIEITAIAVKH